jgi:hypothetical protein
MLRALAVALLTIAACAPSASAAVTRCDALRGPAVVKTATLKVTAKKVDKIYKSGGTRVIGKAYYGCALPRGIVRRLGQNIEEHLWENGKTQYSVGSERVRTGPSAGARIMVRQSYGNLTGDAYGIDWYVYDLRTGKRFSVFSSDAETSSPFPEPKTWALDAQGRVAAILSDSSPGDYETFAPLGAEIDAFRPPSKGTGKAVRSVLDTGATGSFSALTLLEGVVGWKKGAEQKSAPFPVA